MTAKMRGEDGPLVLHYYSDSNKSLRGRHTRANTVPLPAVLRKFPPSLGLLVSTSQHDGVVPGEGSGACLLQLPDGSGFCK